MIKHLLSIALLLACITANAQSFSAKYNFALTATVTPSTIDPTPPPTSTGVTFGSFSAVGVGTISTSSGSFTYDTWGTGALTNDNVPTNYTGALDLGKYYDVSVTPQAGYEVTLTDMTFSTRRSSTGPRQYAVRSSMDAYTGNLSATPSTNTIVTIINSNEFFISIDGNTSTYAGNTITFSSPVFIAFTSPVDIRFYAWNSEGTAGSFRLDSVIINGSATVSTGLGKVSFDLNSNFNIYPVPSHDGMVYIENKNMIDLNKIDVLDILGNVVLSTNFKNETKLKLNLSDMINGNYFVRMYSGNTVSTQKIVIIK
jgi:hypothetical protein